MLNENSTAEMGLYIGTIQALGSYIYSKNIVNSNGHNNSKGNSIIKPNKIIS